MNGPNEAVAAAIAASQASRPENTEALAAIRAKAREVQSLKLEISDMEERIEAAKARINHIQMNELVAMFEAAQLREKVSFSAEGNSKALQLAFKPYYSAHIPVDAPEDFRTEAFAYLEEAGGGNLIKTTVTINFPKEDRARVAEFLRTMPDNLDYTVNASVHKATLTKWLREKIEAGVMPLLEKINGRVGRIVEVKDK